MGRVMGHLEHFWHWNRVGHRKTGGTRKRVDSGTRGCESHVSRTRASEDLGRDGGGMKASIEFGTIQYAHCKTYMYRAHGVYSSSTGQDRYTQFRNSELNAHK